MRKLFRTFTRVLSWWFAPCPECQRKFSSGSEAGCSTCQDIDDEARRFSF